jgi:uncharacterized damage-inducible protein DinB
MDEQLIETWHINQRINQRLLDAIPPEALADTPVGMSGRSVRAIFAHLHNVRLMWLEEIGPQQFSTQTKIPARSDADQAQIDHALLTASLAASADAMAEALRERLASGKTAPLKPHPTGFIGYMLAHEGYHRGEICMQLTQAGHKLPDQVLYGIWDWGNKG